MNEQKQAGRRGWPRRRALTLMGAAASAALLPSRVLFAKPASMVVATGGGKLDDAYKQTVFAAWKQASGIDIVTASNQPAKLKSMVEQKQVEWSIAQGAGEEYILFARQGLFEPIDYTVVDKRQLIAHAAYADFVLTDVAAYHIAWNTDNVKSNPPRTWREVWAHNGRIGLLKQPAQTLEVALLADGVAQDRLYPLDVERGFNSLAKIKHKIVWWSSGAQGAQLLIGGEVDVGAIWNGRVYEPKQRGAPVDYHFNQAIFVCDAWAVPKGAPHKKEAMQLIALELSAKNQAAFAKMLPYGPVNQAALPLIDAKTMSVLPSSPANFKKGTMLNLEYWADHGEKVTDRFNNWLLA